jgi:hypothetical protein
VANVIERMCTFDPDARLSAAQVEDAILGLGARVGLAVDLPAWAAEHVRPIVAARASPQPEQHPDWDHIAFLDERSQEGEAPVLLDPAPTKKADAGSPLKKWLQRMFGG